MSRERSGSRMHPFIDQFQVLRDVSLVDVSTHSTHYVRIMQYVILAVVSRGTLHSNPDDSATPPATPICTTRVQIRTCTSRTPPSRCVCLHLKKATKSLLFANHSKHQHRNLIGAVFLEAPSYLENRTYDKSSRTHFVRRRNEY